jgi:hypothetical protein
MWLLIISKSVATHSTSVLQSSNEARLGQMLCAFWDIAAPCRLALWRPYYATSTGCDVGRVCQNRNPTEPRRDDDIDG